MPSDTSQTPPSLSPRERDVLQGLADAAGSSTPVIAGTAALRLRGHEVVNTTIGTPYPRQVLTLLAAPGSQEDVALVLRQLIQQWHWHLAVEARGPDGANVARYRDASTFQALVGPCGDVDAELVVEVHFDTWPGGPTFADVLAASSTIDGHAVMDDTHLVQQFTADHLFDPPVTTLAGIADRINPPTPLVSAAAPPTWNQLFQVWLTEGARLLESSDGAERQMGSGRLRMLQLVPSGVIAGLAPPVRAALDDVVTRIREQTDIAQDADIAGAAKEGVRIIAAAGDGDLVVSSVAQAQFLRASCLVLGEAMLTTDSSGPATSFWSSVVDNPDPDVARSAIWQGCLAALTDVTRLPLLDATPLASARLLRATVLAARQATNELAASEWVLSVGLMLALVSRLPAGDLKLSQSHEAVDFVAELYHRAAVAGVYGGILDGTRRPSPAVYDGLGRTLRTLAEFLYAHDATDRRAFAYAGAGEMVTRAARTLPAGGSRIQEFVRDVMSSVARHGAAPYLSLT